MKKVFIAHGHDSGSLFELKDFLSTLKLEPLVLFQQDDLGLTIVEKFERYASQCEFAFVLLTPDDKQSGNLVGSERWRARQNVILELGWLMRHVSRQRTVLLHKGTVEIPSDILGVLYLPFEHTIFEVSERIRVRLAGQGFL